MADKMTYQQARRIRNKDYSLTNLITRNIRSKDMGAGESIKAAFKEKFDVGTRLKAKVTGIKEKFDILNIAKFMTGGSNVAPALLGKMLGRKKADIRNFTGGRQSYEDFGSPTATKIGRDPHEGGDQTGMSEVLNKILELQQRTYDNLKEQRETKNNFQEERDIESKKRHDDLLKAIKGFKPDGKQTAEKVTESGGMDLMSTIQSMLDSFGGAKSALTLLTKIGSFFLYNPIGIGLIGGATLLTLLATDKNPEATTKGILAAGDVGEANKQMMEVVENTSGAERRKENLLASRPSEFKASFLKPWEDKGYQDKYLAKIGFDPKTGLTEAEKNEGFTGVNDEGLPYKKPQQTPSATPTGSETTSPAPTSSTAPTAAPAASTPPSQQLSAATSENKTAKMDAMTPPATTTVNNMQSNNQSKKKQQKDEIPSVRNMEATFQRMIFNSTRVV